VKQGVNRDNKPDVELAGGAIQQAVEPGASAAALTMNNESCFHGA
jgi:hypothetical protein